MDPEDKYLYRGTTLDWEGTTINRTLPMTCTSTDPLVATLFSLECKFRGHAVVLMARRDSVSGFIGSANHFSDWELSVNLKIKPLEFMDHVVHQIGADTAREILEFLGFEVPYLIYGKAKLGEELSLDPTSRRLSPSQIVDFNRLAMERFP